jgi:hypothetical protein
MTVFGKFLVTVIVSFFCMIGALGAKYPTPLIGLAILSWVLFVWSMSPGTAKREKREQQKMFEEFIKFKKRGY